MDSCDRRDDVTRFFTELGPRWQDTYESPTPFGHHVTTRLRSCAALLHGVTGRLLDLGCGTGAVLPMVGSTCSGYEGIDRSTTMVEATRARIQSLRLGPDFAAREGDVERLPFPSDHFEAVIALGLLGFFDDPLPVVREALRVTKPGGRLVFSTTRRNSVNHLALKAARPLHAVYRRLKVHGPAAPRFVGFTDARFRQVLESAGCVVLEARHHDKRIVPFPLGHLWPWFACRSAELVEGWPALTAFATGYVVACAKE